MKNGCSHERYCSVSSVSVLLRSLLCGAICVALCPFMPIQQAEAATTHIVNGDFNYGATSVFNCPDCQWAYLDLNNKYFATGQDCSVHTKKNTWSALPPDFSSSQFGWKSSQQYDGSHTWENGTVSQVANCVEIQREYNGNYYAELTADQTNTYIYQDISTEPGAIYQWSLKHASRASDSLDSMSVMIGSLSSQTPQNASRTSVNGLGDKTGDVGTVIATPSSRPYDAPSAQRAVQWETYSGVYIVPSGQTQTRFTFKALTSRSPNTGNLVDDISFTRSYALNYDLTGGNSTLIYSDARDQNYCGYHREGSTVSLTSARPSRTGYTFLGWSRTRLPDITNQQKYEAAKKNMISNFTMPSTATTVYAVWAKDPTVTFTNGIGSIIRSQTVAFGKDATAPPNPIRTGYAFAGWNTSFNQIYSDLTVEATWVPHSYTVNFEPNHGIGFMESERFVYDDHRNLAFNQFERKGYLFSGWNTHANGSGTAYVNGQEIMNLSPEDGASITLYAQWEPVNYFVAFEANGGTGTMINQLLTFDQPDTLQGTLLKRTGFRWVGWNTHPSVPETSYEDKALVENLAERANEVVTLYAIWSANRCLIVYDRNGGVGTMRAQSLAYGSAESLYPNAFSRKGYRWVGWNTKPDGTGESFSDEQSVQDLSTIDNSTIILYALWEEDHLDPPSDQETNDPDQGTSGTEPKQDENDPTASDDEAAIKDKSDPTPSEETGSLENPDNSAATTNPQDRSDAHNADTADQNDQGDHEALDPSKIGSAPGTEDILDKQDARGSFAKTGESLLPALCIALVLLAGGIAFIIAGRRNRKRSQDRKRQLFRSFLEP